MVSSAFLDKFPLFVMNLIITGVVLLLIELGWQLGNYMRGRHLREGKAPIDAAVGPTLGLLAFLLAFSFSMAATRYDTRKEIVLREANAIGTTYLRADFLDESRRKEVRSILREYTALRAGGASSIMSPEGMKQTGELQDGLWAIAAYIGTHNPTETDALFVESLNDVIDIDAERVTAHRNRIPTTIWYMLAIVTMFTMVAVGYQFGLTGIRSWIVFFLLAAVFATVITLIVDLDTPQAGMLQVSQQPLLDLLVKFGTPVP